MTLTKLKHIRPKSYSVRPGLMYDVLVRVRQPGEDPNWYQHWIYDADLEPVQLLGTGFVPDNGWTEDPGDEDTEREAYYLQQQHCWMVWREFLVITHRPTFRLNFFGGGGVLGNPDGDDIADIMLGFDDRQDGVEGYELVFVGRAASALYLLVRVNWWFWPEGQEPWTLGTVGNGDYSAATLAVVRVDAPGSYSVVGRHDYEFETLSPVNTLNRVWLTSGHLFVDSTWADTPVIDHLLRFVVPAGVMSPITPTESWTGRGEVPRGVTSLFLTSAADPLVQQAGDGEGPITTIWPAGHSDDLEFPRHITLSVDKRLAAVAGQEPLVGNPWRVRVDDVDDPGVAPLVDIAGILPETPAPPYETPRIMWIGIRI